MHKQIRFVDPWDRGMLYVTLDYIDFIYAFVERNYLHSLRFLQMCALFTISGQEVLCRFLRRL